MRKLFFASIFSVSLLATPFAATSGTLTLTGTVSGLTDIVVTPIAGYNSLDLTSDQTDLDVATVTERCNLAAGYTVTLTSSNGVADSLTTGALKNGTASLAYTIKYDSVSVSLTDGVATITDVASATDSTGAIKTLAISYTGDPDLVAGSYTDTLTFTIASK